MKLDEKIKYIINIYVKNIVRDEAVFASRVLVVYLENPIKAS